MQENWTEATESCVEIPSPVDLGIIDQIDVNVMNRLLSFVSEILRENIKCRSDAVCVSADSMKSVTGNIPSREMLEVLATKIAERGWTVRKHYTHDYLDALVISPNLSGAGITAESKPG